MSIMQFICNLCNFRKRVIFMDKQRNYNYLCVIYEDDENFIKIIDWLKENEI